MRYWLSLLILVPLSLEAEYRLNTSVGETIASGFVTTGAYYSTRNSFESTKSDEVVNYSAIGGTLYHTFNQYVSAAVRVNTDHPLDYGFLSIQYPMPRADLGVRVGRINVLSGLFSGLGPSVDGMNFLPQGTDPSRLGVSVYRFDGAQFYLNYNLSLFSEVTLEVSYGENVIDSNIGVFEPAFAVLLDPATLSIDYERPAWLINLNVRYKNLEFMFSRTDMVGELSGVYRNQIPLGLLTENPEDMATLVPFELEVKDNIYPSVLTKAGVSYGVGDFEHLFTVIQWVDRPGNEDLGGIAFSPKYTSRGFTYMLRHSGSYQWMEYGGYSEYRSTFDNEELAQALKESPDWIDRGQEVFAGVRWLFKRDSTLLLEGRWIKGGIFLNAKYQNPTETKEYWSLYSVTLNYHF